MKPKGGSEFYSEIKAIRVLLAESGLEITIEDLLDVLEKALDDKAERACPFCDSSMIGLCFSCLKEMVRNR